MLQRSRARGQGCRGCLASSLPHRTGNDGSPSVCPEVPCLQPLPWCWPWMALSQLAVSTKSKAPALQLAASSSCTLGHGSHSLDTAGTVRHTPRPQTHSNTALTQLRHNFETFCWSPGGCPGQVIPGCSQEGSLGSAVLTPSNNNTTAQSLSHFYLHHCTAHFPRMHWNVVGQTPIAHIHELNISSGKEDKTQRVTIRSCRGTCNNSNYWQ